MTGIYDGVMRPSARRFLSVVAILVIASVACDRLWTMTNFGWTLRHRVDVIFLAGLVVTPIVRRIDYLCYATLLAWLVSVPRGWPALPALKLWAMLLPCYIITISFAFWLITAISFVLRQYIIQKRAN